MSDPQQPHTLPPAQPSPYTPPPSGPAAPLLPPAPSNPQAARSGRNPVATSAFVFGLITFALGLLWTAAQPTVVNISAGDVSTIVMIGASATFVIVACALTALVLGLIGLRIPGRRARAGIAIGIAMYASLSTVFAFAGMFVSGLS